MRTAQHVARPAAGGSGEPRRPVPSTAMLAAAGIVGHEISLAVAWLLPAVSEYGLVDDTISELALGRFGFMQTLAFVAVGLGTLAVVVALRRATTGIRGSRLGTLLLACYGVGPLLAAIFPTDRVDTAADLQSLSLVGTLHVASALLGFLGGVAGVVVLSVMVAGDARWGPLRRLLPLLATAAFSLLLGQSEGPWVGLMQRGLTTTLSLWVVLLAIRLRAIAAVDAATADRTVA